MSAPEAPGEDAQPLLEEKPQEKLRKLFADKRVKAAGGCLACSCCCYFSLVLLMGFLGYKFLATLPVEPGAQVYNDGVKVVPSNVSAYEWWLGCYGPEGSNVQTYGPTSEITNCGSECCNCKQRDAFREYTSQADFQEVWFPSREGQSGQERVKLMGWWLPADPQWDSKAAIILQHGLRGTVNDFRGALAAYLLRSAGFSVLMPNLRGHGESQPPKHNRLSWGYGYPFDILGAWDYLIKDPDNKTGGPRDPSKIGIMGFSMGGYVAATAFGLEGRIAGLWIDGAVSDPKDILPGYLESKVPIIGHPLTRILKDPAWGVTEFLSRMNVNHHAPEGTLPRGPPTARSVMLVQSRDDDVVPFFMAEKYRRIFEAESDKYNLTVTWDWGGRCDTGAGRVETHVVLQWLHPEEYRRLLCKFWTQALLKQSCDESQLVPLSYS